MKRTAKAIWNGTGMDGSGTLTTKSGALNEQPYSFKTRFKNENGKSGTNPEELIAAAHAGCFNMALSFQLGAAGFSADELTTEAIVSMEKNDDGFKIVHIELQLVGKVHGIDKESFLSIAENAKKSCPISQALSAVEISLTAELL